MMRVSLFIFAATSTVCGALSPRVPQEPVVAEATTSQQRARAVQDAFSFAWDGYTKYAFGNDELHPVSNTFGNTRWAPSN